jgi:hypothetical protein
MLRETKDKGEDGWSLTEGDRGSGIKGWNGDGRAVMMAEVLRLRLCSVGGIVIWGLRSLSTVHIESYIRKL